jgi:hypothetical protein
MEKKKTKKKSRRTRPPNSQGDAVIQLLQQIYSNRGKVTKIEKLKITLLTTRLTWWLRKNANY